MGACATEFSSLPLLAGCPSDDEYFLVGNAIGGLGAGGYARRRYADLKACILAGLSFIPLQFEVGQPGSPLNEGDTELIITVANPIQDSETVNLDNTPLQPNLTGQISYSAVYTSTNITFTFTQGVINGQKYYIKYATN